MVRYIILLIGFIFAIAFLRSRWRELKSLRKQFEQKQQSTMSNEMMRQCVVCGTYLPVSQMRQHHSQWRCIHHDK